MVIKFIKFVFSLIIIVPDFLVYHSIMTPLNFNSEVNNRSEVIKVRLKKLSTTGFLFKQIHELSYAISSGFKYC